MFVHNELKDERNASGNGEQQYHKNTRNRIETTMWMKARSKRVSERERKREETIKQEDIRAHKFYDHLIWLCIMKWMLLVDIRKINDIASSATMAPKYSIVILLFWLLHSNAVAALRIFCVHVFSTETTTNKFPNFKSHIIQILDARACTMLIDPFSDDATHFEIMHV